MIDVSRSVGLIILDADSNCEPAQSLRSVLDMLAVTKTYGELDYLTDEQSEDMKLAETSLGELVTMWRKNVED